MTFAEKAAAWIALWCCIVPICGISRAETPVKPALVILTIQVSRRGSNRIAIRYTLKNEGDTEAYLPCVEIPEVTYMQTFQLLHHSADGNWVKITKYYDVPSGNAKIIKQGESITLDEEFFDPAAYQVPGTPRAFGSVTLEGANKIRIGYFSGAKAWQARQDAFRSLRTHEAIKMPAMDYAESAEFVIVRSGQ